jgi:U3 small nucleolar RNA-associated protein 20
VARPRNNNSADAGGRPLTLLERFRDAVSGDGGDGVQEGSTDAAARLTHLLRALKTAGNNGVEGKSKEWVPLFLDFSAAKALHSAASVRAQDGEDTAAGDEEHLDDDLDSDAEEKETVVSPGKAWRAALKEWLGVIAGLKGARGVYRADAVKAAVAAHVMDPEPDVQTAALRCLRAFKLQWLAPYLDRVARLADNKTLRAELAAFPLAVRYGTDN